MPLTFDEQQLFEDAIRRFSQEQILPRTCRYETALPATELNALAQQLQELGIFAGLWADMSDANTTALSINLLQTLAHSCSALALLVHRHALAQHILRSAELNDTAAPALIITGHYGLARLSLGRYLAAKSITHEDQAMLGDWLSPERERLLLATDEPDYLLWPIWEKDSIQWQLVHQNQLTLYPQRSHGLDELNAFSVKKAGRAQANTNLSAEAARQLYAQVFKADLLGLCAIATGALSRTATLGQDYAALRRQGGHTINQHAAVQCMLSEIQAAQWQAHSYFHAAQQGINQLGLEPLVAMRFMLSERLVQASHQVIQIHGGVGYMQDTGPEKFMREQNMLHLQSGGAAGLNLLLQGVSA